MLNHRLKASRDLWRVGEYIEAGKSTPLPNLRRFGRNMRILRFTLWTSAFLNTERPAEERESGRTVSRPHW